MLEKSEGGIDWKHTNLHTIERVLTFLYYGDYNSPNPTLRNSEDQRNEVDESELKVDTRDAEHVANPEARAEGSPGS